MYHLNNQWFASFEGMTVHEGKLFFSEWSDNEIYKYDYEKSRLDYICQIDKEDELGERLFSALCVKEDRLFLSPFSANSIYLIDINTGHYREIYNFEKDYTGGRAYSPKAKMMGIHTIGDDVYFMPVAFPGILKYNEKNARVELLDCWIDNVEESFGTKDIAYARGTIKLDQCIYIPLCNGNGVVIWNSLKDEYEIRTVNGVDNGFSDICFDGSKFWLSSRYRDTLTICNRDMDLIRVVRNDLFKNVTRIEFFNGYVYLFPQQNGPIIRIDACNVEDIKMEIVSAGVSVLSTCCEKNSMFWFDFKKGELGYNEKNIKVPYLNIMESKHNKLFSKLYYSIKKNGGILPKDTYYEEYSEALLDFMRHIRIKYNS